MSPRAPAAKRCSRSKISSVTKRVQLDTALDYVPDGDTPVVSKLDLLGPRHGYEHRRVSYCSVPTLIGTTAYFERDMMLELQLRNGASEAKVGPISWRSTRHCIRRQSLLQSYQVR